MEGIVEGDFLSLGGSVTIAGEVRHTTRVVGGHILVSGKMGGNVSCLAARLQILPTASLAGNLVVASMHTELASAIAGDATIVSANARIASRIQHNLQGYMGQLRLTAKAYVEGDVDYRSNQEAVIDPGATIEGQLIYHPSFMHKMVAKEWIHRFFVGSQVVVLAMNVLYTLVIGWVLLRYFPANLYSALATLRTQPFQAFFCGLLFTVVMPLLLLILLVSILGVPFALTLLAFNIVGFYGAKVYPLLWIARWVQSKRCYKQIVGPFLAITASYFALTAIPVLGRFIAFAAL
jgi:cytoskeletal protein CcmA (bactofilin family)